MTKNILIAVVGMFVVIGVLWFSDGSRRAALYSNDDAEAESLVHKIPVDGPTGFAMVASNAVYVADQLPGREVLVNMAYLELSGYVIIHASQDGNPGAIIGNSKLIENGGGNNFRVMLSRNILDGEELIAMLHVERGGVGFDPSTDTPVRDQNENVVYTIFHVNRDATNPSLVEIRF